jgi:hypothetical protein
VEPMKGDHYGPPPIAFVPGTIWANVDAMEGRSQPCLQSPSCKRRVMRICRSREIEDGVMLVESGRHDPTR